MHFCLSEIESFLYLVPFSTSSFIPERYTSLSSHLIWAQSHFCCLHDAGWSFPQLVQWEGTHPALPAIEFHPLQHSLLFSLHVWHSSARVLSWCYMISIMPVKARRLFIQETAFMATVRITKDENWIWFVFFFFSTLLHYDKQQQKLDMNFLLTIKNKLKQFQREQIFFKVHCLIGDYIDKFIADN